MLTVKNAHSPVWSDADHTTINLLVTFEETANTLGEMPFTASPNDCEAHGQAIYAAAVVGEYGAVSEYVAPTFTTDQLEVKARAWRDTEITASQWLVDRHRDQAEAGTATTLTADQYSALLVYRQALRDWPSVADFPADSTMPAAPAGCPLPRKVPPRPRDPSRDHLP